jgi:hypothetical protein
MDGGKNGIEKYGILKTHILGIYENHISQDTNGKR